MGIKGLKLNGYMSESLRYAVLAGFAYLLDMSRLLCSVRLTLHLIRSFSHLVDHNKGLYKC